MKIDKYKHTKALFLITAIVFVSFLSCSSSEKEDISLAPKLSQIHPESGSPGDRITIYGSNFGDDISALKLYFGETEAQIVSVSPTKIVAILPSQSGKVAVTAKAHGFTSNSLEFTFLSEDTNPLLVSLYPNQAIAGDTILILGKNFVTIFGYNKVYFDNIVSKIISVTDTTIQVVVPETSKKQLNVVLMSDSYQTNSLVFNYIYDYYTNPVHDATAIADPTIIMSEDGYFYLYATEVSGQVPIFRSRNLIDWERAGNVFTAATKPNFVSGGNVWAPDISYINGKYVLHFSMSTWGGTWEAGIGVATADSPLGPFSKGEKMFISSEIGVQNSIDPFYIEDNGKKYLFWGSFKGIYYVELTDDGLSVQPGFKPIKVAGTAFEGVYIHKRNNYYYMFASWGSCCEGLNSTYTTVVARSENLTGPYIDSFGRKMMDNGATTVIQKNAAFAGPGHNSEIVSDDAGNDWILYHAYDTRFPSASRKLMLDQIHWVSDWPTIVNTTPSSKAAIPIFGN